MKSVETMTEEGIQVFDQTFESRTLASDANTDDRSFETTDKTVLPFHGAKMKR